MIISPQTRLSYNWPGISVKANPSPVHSLSASIDLGLIKPAARPHSASFLAAFYAVQTSTTLNPQPFPLTPILKIANPIYKNPSYD
jgi:hypothetical protein